MPGDLQRGVVIPIFKKGERGLFSNYRGVTLISLPGKAYAWENSIKLGESDQLLNLNWRRNNANSVPDVEQ